LIIFVIAEDGTKLMPTFNVKKVRKILRTGRAVIYKHEPFTIKLTYKTTKYTQPIEFKEDAGYQNIGVSACSEKHEYVGQERVLLKDEVEKHNDCRKYRRTRRNRLRYRAERHDNRKATKQPGWLTPSIENKKNQHMRLLKIYSEVMPITSVVVEVAQFDTQVLKAVQDGAQLPSGPDYQHGERYGYDTLREAVFARDGYNCIICKRNAIKDGVILRMHHLGYWKKDRTNRLNNLTSVCLNCHTSKNHKTNGKLYGLEPITKNMSSAAFMNAVKYQIVEQIKSEFPNLEVRVTFGAITKRTRNDRNIAKTHANDAYCIGEYHPKHRARAERYQKRRRNNRVLEKFYDAKLIDIRDGSKKSGSDLSCGRTNRREPRNSLKNERPSRGEKVSKGRRTIRRRRYVLRPNDVVLYDRQKYRVVGVQNNGAYTKLEGLTKVIRTELLTPVRHIGGWAPAS
jgi:hypothetical protein